MQRGQHEPGIVARFVLCGHGMGSGGHISREHCTLPLTQEHDLQSSTFQLSPF